MAPGQSDDAYQIAGDVGEAVATRAQRLKNITSNYYQRAEDSGVIVPKDAIGSLSQRLSARLEENVMMLDGQVSDGLPDISRIKASIDKMASSEGAGLDWRLVERNRQALVAASRKPGPESIGINAMKEEMDDWITDTVVAGLATGDKKFGSDLLKARRFASQAFDISRNKNKIIQKMSLSFSHRISFSFIRNRYLP